MTKRPIVAFLYDFDKTLCTTDMEDYAFIPSLGYTPSEFWAKANGFGYENKMDGLLAYMYTMIRECAAQGIRLDRDYLVRSGEAIELFPGVREWFGRINAFGAQLGRSWTSTSRTRRSSSTASTRAFLTSPATRNSTTPCPTTPSACRSPTWSTSATDFPTCRA